MERKHIRMRRDEILRLKYIKSEYIHLILKSILRTRSLKPVIRFHVYTYLHKNHVFLSRWKNYCLLTGRGRGVTKQFNISRHMLNKHSQQGVVTGYTRNNYR